MANIQINQLPGAALPLDGTEIIPADQGLLTVQATLADVVTLANANTVANGLASPSITADILANRPVSAAVGALFVSTLENVIYRYNGSGWNAIGRGDQYVESVVAGTGVTVDNTDPLNPIVSSTGGSGVNTVKVSLTSADILALNTTVFTLIPAQGAGTIINVLKVWYSYNYNTTDYVGGGFLTIKFGSAFGVTVSGNFGGVLNSGGNIIGMPSMSVPGGTSSFGFDNTPVVLYNTTAQTLGDGTLDVYLTYDVITL